MKGTQGPWGGVNAWDAPSPGEAPDRAIAARLRAAQRACEEQCQVRLECVELMLAQTEITKRGKGGTKVKCHATGVYAGTVCYDPLIPDLNERIETLMNKGEE